MTDEALKPCPFCGGEASPFEDYGHSSAWEVGCFNGDCRVEPHVWEKTKAEAIAAWNTRYKPKAEELFDQQIADYVKRGKP
jgi:Lar family restriction alleviation protein